MSKYYHLSQSQQHSPKFRNPRARYFDEAIKKTQPQYKQQALLSEKNQQVFSSQRDTTLTMRKLRQHRQKLPQSVNYQKDYREVSNLVAKFSVQDKKFSMNYDKDKNSYRISMPKIQIESSNDKRSAVFKVDHLVRTNAKALNFQQKYVKESPKEKLESFMSMYSRSSKAGVASQRLQLAKSLNEQIEALSPNASTSKKVKLERFMHRIAQIRDENEDKDLNMHQQVAIKKQLERAKQKFSPEPKHPILAVYKQYRDLGESGLEVTPFEPSRIERILSGLERIDQDKNRSATNEDLNFDQGESQIQRSPSLTALLEKVIAKEEAAHFYGNRKAKKENMLKLLQQQQKEKDANNDYHRTEGASPFTLDDYPHIPDLQLPLGHKQRNQIKYCSEAQLQGIPENLEPEEVVDQKDRQYESCNLSAFEDVDDDYFPTEHQGKSFQQYASQQYIGGSSQISDTQPNGSQKLPKIMDSQKHNMHFASQVLLSPRDEHFDEKQPHAHQPSQRQTLGSSGKQLSKSYDKDRDQQSFGKHSSTQDYIDKSLMISDAPVLSQPRVSQPVLTAQDTLPHIKYKRNQFEAIYDVQQLQMAEQLRQKAKQRHTQRNAARASQRSVFEEQHQQNIINYRHKYSKSLLGQEPHNHFKYLTLTNSYNPTINNSPAFSRDASGDRLDPQTTGACSSNRAMVASQARSMLSNARNSAVILKRPNGKYDGGSPQVEVTNVIKNSTKQLKQGKQEYLEMKRQINAAEEHLNHEAESISRSVRKYQLQVLGEELIDPVHGIKSIDELLGDHNFERGVNEDIFVGKSAVGQAKAVDEKLADILCSNKKRRLWKPSKLSMNRNLKDALNQGQSMY